MTHSRETAILFKHTPNGVWYLTMSGGKVNMLHASDEVFLRVFPLILQDYPLLRAVRKYMDSSFERDEQTAKVLRILLRM